MTDRKTFEKRRTALKLLTFPYRQRTLRNTVQLSAANSLAHEMKKAEICYKLKKLGYEFYTEAEFCNLKGRADIFVLDELVAIEVIESEKPESIKAKRNYYPCRVVPIKTTESFHMKMIL